MSDIEDHDKKPAAVTGKSNKNSSGKEQPKKSPRHVRYNRRRSKKRKDLINYEKSWD